MRVVVPFVLLVLIAAIMAPSAALGQTGCVAQGSSDGDTAQAAVLCSSGPDDVIFTPLGVLAGCEILDYDLIVEDDLIFPVFPMVILSPEPDDELDENSHNKDLRSSFFPLVADRRFSETGRWWRRSCWATKGGVLALTLSDGPFPEGPEVSLLQLVEAARAVVDPPELPSIVHAGPTSLMQLPTWFWADHSWWNGDYSASASHGRVSVSVAAIPEAWDLSVDEAEVMRCGGGGIPWRHGLSEFGACTYTFTDVDEVGTIQLEATAELSVFWDSNIPGYSRQPLAPIYRSVVQPHEVIEVVGLRGG